MRDRALLLNTAFEEEEGDEPCHGAKDFGLGADFFVKGLKTSFEFIGLNRCECQVKSILIFCWGLVSVPELYLGRKRDGNDFLSINTIMTRGMGFLHGQDRF